MTMASDLASALDAVVFAQKCGIQPDQWQADFLRSPSRRVLQLACRQAGKTTSTGIKALHVASYEPGSTIVVVAPAERQSREFVRAAKLMHRAIDGAVPLRGDSVTKIEFENESRIIALPGGEDGRGIRGLAKVRLLILDEGALISDELLQATRPMLAVHPRAEMVILSTPKGRRGFFYELWHNNDPLWSRIRVTTDMCPRITPEFLAEERKILGPVRFSEEYGLEFVDNEMAAFPAQIIDGIFSKELRALWR